METEKEQKLKSRQQEKSYHVLFQQISDHCTAVGLDQKTILDKLIKYEVSTSPQFVKSVWRSIMLPLTGKESTKDMTRAEVKEVQVEFGKFWSEVTGEQILWPSVENMLLLEYDKANFKSS